MRIIDIIGSSSWAEHFKGDGVLDGSGRYQGSKFCSCSEGCVTVTWLQLNWHLLRLTGKAKYASELERITFNALLGA
ncbi:MAG: glycoside hydrolase family 127 protein [Ardenticatenia bacterium]|nr:glycoside hydrolase family 127 protein [Ardenticatenia bacterium]